MIGDKVASLISEVWGMYTVYSILYLCLCIMFRVQDEMKLRKVEHEKELQELEVI